MPPQQYADVMLTILRRFGTKRNEFGVTVNMDVTTKLIANETDGIRF